MKNRKREVVERLVSLNQAELSYLLLLVEEDMQVTPYAARVLIERVRQKLLRAKDNRRN